MNKFLLAKLKCEKGIRKIEARKGIPERNTEKLSEHAQMGLGKSKPRPAGTK